MQAGAAPNICYRRDGLRSIGQSTTWNWCNQTGHCTRPRHLFHFSCLSSRSTSPAVTDSRDVRFFPCVQANRNRVHPFRNSSTASRGWRRLPRASFPDDGISVSLRESSRLVQATRACGRCFTGHSLAYPFSCLIRSRSGRTLSTLRINTLPEEMIGMTNTLLTSLPCVSPQSTKVTIEQFRDADMIPVGIHPRFGNLGGVAEIGEQRAISKIPQASGRVPSGIVA